MNPIGGYFGLELRQGSHFHASSIRLNTARNCLEYILLLRHYRKVYIPYYTCEVVFEPIKKLGIEYEFYHINNVLEPADCPALLDGEAFLYTNYFGLKDNVVRSLVQRYHSALIVDNSQAFFSKPYDDIDTFYSARKFFGVPDGAYLFVNERLKEDFPKAKSFERVSHLIKRLDSGAEQGYEDFKRNDSSLSNQQIMLMSNFTSKILMSVDYEWVAFRRKANYAFLNEKLGSSNLVKLILEGDSVPMVYPYYTTDGTLRERLINNKIFIAKYWPNVIESQHYALEVKMANNLLPLPIDQRYGEEEMSNIVKIILG